VICEAARIGTPVMASRVSGNVGMLGRRYPGFYPLFDTDALARRLRRAAVEPRVLARLKSALRARRRLFAPQAEGAALAAVIDEALGQGHHALKRGGDAAARSTRRRG
jgi:glycosyltransferase involved in cell wall biosynthesis